MRALLALALAALVASPGVSSAVERCAGELQKNACAEATGFCPPSAPVGLTASDWPVFQRDVQHTGKAAVAGPACGTPTFLWKSKIKGKINSAPFIGAAAPGQHGIVYVAAGKNPVCAFEPTAGTVLWCKTNELGRDVGFGNAVGGNGNLIYVGTRDNDLWALDKPSPEVVGSQATVLWRQKVCTDGDVGTPPIIGTDGVVYMGSDSLEGGSVFAMCPGATRQVKWCRNPVGGPVSQVSPALSPDGATLYVTYSGTTLVAFDADSGQEKWRITLETRRNQGKMMNFSPVVHPVTGRVYLGFDEGLFAVDTQIVEGNEVPVKTLLFPTYATVDRTRIQSPPVLDLASDTIYFGASRGSRSKLYAISFAGALKWKKDLSRGAFKNNPPILDSAGRVYVAMKKRVHAFSPAGVELWGVDSKEIMVSSPILDDGRLYVGTTRGSIQAIGCAP